jgi:hypothetical protein
MACEMTGVGVKPPPAWKRTATPLAASTSRVVRCAGADSAWVSMPRKSGPATPRRGAVFGDRLGDGEDVRLVEAAD